MEQPNPRNASRLRFTNEELQTNGLKTPDRKAKQKAIQAKKLHCDSLYLPFKGV